MSDIIACNIGGQRDFSLTVTTCTDVVRSGVGAALLSHAYPAHLFAKFRQLSKPRRLPDA